MLHIFDRLNSPSHILLLENRGVRITELEYARAKAIISKYQDRDITQHIRYNTMLTKTMQQIGLIGEEDRCCDIDLKYQPTTKVKDDDEILIVDCVRVYKAEIVSGVNIQDVRPIAEALCLGDEHKTVESLVTDSVIMIGELLALTVAQKFRLDNQSSPNKQVVEENKSLREHLTTEKGLHDNLKQTYQILEAERDSLKIENEKYLDQLDTTAKKLGIAESEYSKLARLNAQLRLELDTVFNRLSVSHIDQIKDTTIKKPRKPRVTKKEVRTDIE